jgi:putative hydrolase of the HAD superfamily
VKILFEIYTTPGINNHSVFNKFLKKTQGEIDYRVLANAIVAYRNTRQTFTVPYPNTKYTLIKLKELGLKLGVVSDAPRMAAWLRLAEMDITEFFNSVITLGDSKRLKPHPTAFKKALRKLKLKPEEVLFIGDNPGRDIKGAKAVGMKTVLAKYGQTRKSKIKADYEIKDIRDLIKIVKQNNK